MEGVINLTISINCFRLIMDPEKEDNRYETCGGTNKQGEDLVKIVKSNTFYF